MPRPAKHATAIHRETERNQQALRVFEAEVGGRDALVSHLNHASMTEEQVYLVGMIADPRNAGKSLAHIAALAEVPIGRLYKFFQEAGFVAAQLAAFRKVWAKLPEVAGDVMEKAVPRLVPCGVCKETGELEYEVKADREDGSPWKRGDPVGSEIKACWNCQGEKQVLKEPTLETQKVALQIGGVLQQGGVQVGVQVNTQNNLNGGGLSRDALKDFRAASDRVLFPSKRRGDSADPADSDEVEAEVVSK